jgi:hypothetical protein
LDDFSLQFSTLIIDQMPMKTFILTAAIIKISLMTSAESVWRVNHQSSPGKPWLIRNNSRWKIKIRTAVLVVVVSFQSMQCAKIIGSINVLYWLHLQHIIFVFI